MRRSNIVLIVLIAVVIGFLVYLNSLKRDTSDFSKWQFNYRYGGDKMAYDRDFFIDYLKKESEAFTALDERFSRTDYTDSLGLYLFYNTNFSIDETETDALYQFVAKGNNALVIAEHFNHSFFKKIRGLQVEKDVSYFALNTLDSAKTIYDTLEMGGKSVPIEIITYGQNPLQTSLRVDTSNTNEDYYTTGGAMPWEEEAIENEDDAYVYDEEDYTYEEETDATELSPVDIQVNEIELPDVNPIVNLSAYKDNGINLVRVDLGEGSIYIHTNPVLFTNAQFDKPEVFDYVKTLFSDIEFTDVYWDELAFQFLNAKNEGYGLSDKSYLEYIFKNRALKTAFYFFLIGLLVFLIVGIKRKYRAIEIVDPVTNSSIDFSKTIARLYWLNPNHRKMADQKMKMFLFEVRNRYGLTTHELDDEFKSKFKAKSGVSDKHINRLFDAYNLARQSPSIHEDVLIQISESIVIIRQQWK